MDMKNYNPAEIESLVTEAGTISQSVNSFVNEIDTQYEALDSRIRRKFGDMFAIVSKTNRTIGEEAPNVDKYQTWLNDTLADYNTTNTNVNAISERASDGTAIDGSLTNNLVGAGAAGALGGLGAVDESLDNNASGNGNASNTGDYNFNPGTIENLPSDVQEGIKAKLKELGFTDEEIEKILNGKMGVSKVALEELSSKLEQALKNDPSLRNKLIEIYGFDIFNEDGTINKDKLALAMIMDGKNPNDKYDLNAFLKKLNGSPNTEKPTVKPIPDDVINNIIDNVAENAARKPQISNNLVGSAETLEEALESEDLISLGTDLTNISGSISKSKEILPTGNTKVKKGSFGAVASVAGLGSAIAAAAGGMSIANKKKAEGADDDVDDDDDDIEIISEEDKYLNDDDSDDDDKDWLYGLGIGLVGAGSLASLIPDDEDEDEEDDDDDDNNNGYYPTF